MAAIRRNPRLFISVAEQSADEHAAELVRAFRKLHPQASFHGLAGPALREAGCECIEDLTAKSAMAMAALKRIPESFMLLRRLKRYLRSEQFDAAVVVDSPALNLPIAKLARQCGIPVLYYIAPQTWAWGPRDWRNARLRKRVNRLACLWPFEQPYFRKAGIKATYVGHPSFDRLLEVTPDEARVKELRGDDAPVIALLPGSRRHVVEEVLPGQLEIAESLRIRFPKSHFIAVAANEPMSSLIRTAIGQPGVRASITLVTGEHDRAAAIRAADLALVASGTVTLEVAYRETPMLVMYNAGRLPYLLFGRWLITTKFLSIPNILADREIVPEFMPYYRSTDPIIARVVDWLSSPGALERVRQDLAATIKPIMKAGAAKNTAAELDALLEENQGDEGAH